MKKIGLTGNIGSGKSLVSEILIAAGIPVFNADAEAKKILFSDLFIPLLLENFGEDVFSNEKPDRIKIARLVFSDENKRRILNELIHPLTRAAFEDWCVEHQKFESVVMEAAIMIETGLYASFDTIVYVNAPEEIRIARVMLRDKCSREEVLERISAQWPDQKKMQYAQHIILNDGVEALLPQIQRIFSL